MLDLGQFHSCKYCQGFNIDVDKHSPKANHGTFRGPEPDIFGNPQTTIFFDRSLSDVLEGSVKGCEFCEWLDENWRTNFGDRYTQLRSCAQYSQICAETYSRSLIDRLPLDDIEYFGLWENELPSSQIGGRCHVRTRAQIDVFTTKDDLAANFIWNQPINREPGSQKNLELARNWLDECRTSHPDCGSILEQRYMPTRALKLNSQAKSVEGTVHLVIRPPVEPYVALSYCWGGDQLHKTTKAKIESGNFSIDVRGLPSCLRDAIKTTMSLGLQWLWVDSLCIIQDDISDKMIEIDQMPSIYANALVTLSASKSAAAASGFLEPIDYVKNTSMAVKLPFRCPGLEDMHGNAYAMVMPDRRAIDPIHLRAWTLQERYLAPRVLEFSSLQMRWVCNYTVPDEKQGYSDGWKRGQNPEDSGIVTAMSYQDIVKQIESLRKHPALECSIGDDLRGFWEAIVHTYTARNMTDSTDRSLAISGMGKALSALYPDKYLAGLWRRSMPSQLCWTIATQENVYSPGSVPRGKRTLHPRPWRYQGPSWSWTAVNGTVDVMLGRACDKDCRAQLLDAYIELVEQKAEHGAVKCGILTLKGRMRRVMCEEVAPIDEYGALVREYSSNPEDTTNQFMHLTRLLFDCLDPPGTVESEIFLFEIGNCVSLKRRGPVGLVLQRCPGRPQRFTRLGVFRISKEFAGRIPQNIIAEDFRNLINQPWEQHLENELKWFDDIEPTVIQVE
ncbi:hypothetical protein JX266_012666 [Neoarthrinium moseri]|nr:hypothetical protein JX266_012666 [Neoarthrinium moseri]